MIAKTGIYYLSRGFDRGRRAGGDETDPITKNAIPGSYSVGNGQKLTLVSTKMPPTGPQKAKPIDSRVVTRSLLSGVRKHTNYIYVDIQAIFMFRGGRRLGAKKLHKNAGHATERTVCISLPVGTAVCQGRGVENRSVSGEPHIGRVRFYPYRHYRPVTIGYPSNETGNNFLFCHPRPNIRCDRGISTRSSSIMHLETPSTLVLRSA